MFFTTSVPACSCSRVGPVLLIFIGIRNAWDIVTFLAIQRFRPIRSAENRNAGWTPGLRVWENYDLSKQIRIR